MYLSNNPVQTFIHSFMCNCATVGLFSIACQKCVDIHHHTLLTMWRSHIPHSLSCDSMYDLHRCWNQIHEHVYSIHNVCKQTMHLLFGIHNVCKQTMHLFILLLTSESINSLHQITGPVLTKFICSCVTVNCRNASVI